jgi:methionyl-tRNA formyltransferase
MRIVLVTQNDPFYLGKAIQYLLEKMPSYANVAACVVFKPSPYGRKENFVKKAYKALVLFGPYFFLRYGLYYVQSKFILSRSLTIVLKRKRIPIIRLKENVNHHLSLSTIAYYKPDLLISIAGNQIFKKNLINLAPKGCLNLHTALLPKYRGLMPTFWVLKNGEEETGVSVFFVDEGIDSGPILVQKRIPISRNESQRDLILKTKKIGMDAIIEALDLIYSGEYTLIPNDESKMTYYSFPSRNDVREFKKLGKKFF